MRIIKPGTLPKDEILLFRCHHCGCEFECAVSEAIEVSDSLDIAYTFKCPQRGCGILVYSHRK